ncbi:MAG: trypsin-like peptidase domain-containing protein [Opitutae bacterium]|nr:trypsin-like peptidase domain-containing protein [Opitutae bacterium]
MQNVFERVRRPCVESGHVLTLMARGPGNNVFAQGSAVLVAPHLALTARHVTDDFATRYEGQREPVPKASYHITARAFSAKGWHMFDVQRTFNCLGTDITALYLSLAAGQNTNYAWPRITLDLLPPKRGTKVWSWGHVDPVAQVDEANPNITRWWTQLARSSGVVEEIYPLMRDRGMINFPSFRFDAQVDHSMSGGPIFDETGCLVGINSSSIAPDGVYPAHVSNGALLWPVPALTFENKGETFPADRMIERIDDLRLAGFLRVRNASRIKIDRAAPADELSVSVEIPLDRH